LLLFGGRLSVNVRRHLEEGASVGLELERVLARRAAATADRPVPSAVLVPPFAGALEYVAARPREPVTLAVARAFVPSESDAFMHTAAEVRRFFEQILARGRDEPLPARTGWAPAQLMTGEVLELVRDAMGTFLDTARLLGRRTAELHAALAWSGLPGLAPEPPSMHDQRAAYQAMRSLAGKSLRELARADRRRLADATRVPRILGSYEAILERFAALLRERSTAPRTRHVGGLCLKSVLLTGNDLLFADLDGDRTLPAAERRRKASPLRDVAGLVRSLHEATFSALFDASRVRPEDVDAARPWAEAFWEGSAAALLRAYLDEAAEARLIPRSREETAVLLDAFVFESALGTLASTLGAPDAKTTVTFELIVALLDGHA
jgi:maltose alpha-D-glucosyltransferase/alpha-amylase